MRGVQGAKPRVLDKERTVSGVEVGVGESHSKCMIEKSVVVSRFLKDSFHFVAYLM